MTAWLVAGIGALIALLLAFIRGRASGKAAERDANRAKDADAYEAHLREIEEAASARAAVRPDSLQHDKYRRD